MQQFNFISVKLTFFLILGILLGYYFEPKISYVLPTLSISLIILGITFKKETRNGFPFFGIIAATIVILLGAFIVSISNPKNNSLHYTNHLAQNENIWLVKVDEILKPSAFSKRYIVKAKSLHQNEVTGRLILRIPNDSTFLDNEMIFLKKLITTIKTPAQFIF